MGHRNQAKRRHEGRSEEADPDRAEKQSAVPDHQRDRRIHLRDAIERSRARRRNGDDRRDDVQDPDDEEEDGRSVIGQREARR